MKVSVRKVIDFLSLCSFFRNLCTVKSSLQAKLLAITFTLNESALSIAAQPTDVEKLSVLMCEVSLPDNVILKVREVGTAKTE